MRRRRPWLTALKVIVTLALVGLLASRISIAEAAGLLAGASWLPLLAALLVFTLSMLAGAWQWGRFLAALGIALPLPKLLELYWVGLFFNNFLPSNVGGDVVKVIDLSRDAADPVASSAATLADRLTGLAALAILACAAALALRGDPDLAGLGRGVLWGGAVFLGLGVLFLVGPAASWGASLLARLGLVAETGMMARVLDQLREVRSRRRLVLGLLLFSLLVQGLRVCVHWLVALALLGAAAPPLFDIFLVIPPLAFALTLPITVGGLGLREGLALQLFAPLGVAGEAAVAIELLAYLLMLAVSLQGGMLFLLRRGDRAPSA